MKVFVTMRAMRFGEDREDSAWLFDYPKEAKVMERVIHAFVCALARTNAECLKLGRSPFGPERTCQPRQSSIIY